MNERQALIAICEILHTHTMYITGLHRSLATVHEALLRVQPDFEKTHREEMAKIRDFPSSQRLIEQLDEIVQQLKSA